jgi:hypothetical protein
MKHDLVVDHDVFLHGAKDISTRYNTAHFQTVRRNKLPLLGSVECREIDTARDENALAFVGNFSPEDWEQRIMLDFKLTSKKKVTVECRQKSSP